MIMFKNEFDFLIQHSIRAKYNQQIELSISVLSELSNVFEALKIIDYPLNSCSFDCISSLKSLTSPDVELILIKAYWIIDTYQGTSEYSLELLGSDSNVFSELPFGKHLFASIDLFELSPIEDLQVTWTHLFSVIALDRLARLYYISVKETEFDKLFMQHQTPNFKLIYIDLIDCISKAITFKKLLDDGWVKSYHAKQRGMARLTKLNQLKRIVLIRCVSEHRDVDHLSAANAIECQLVAENCPELSLLKSEKRRAKTFAEWISDLRNGLIKIPI